MQQSPDARGVYYDNSRLARLTIIGLSFNAVLEITLLLLTLIEPRAPRGLAAHASALEAGAYILLLTSMAYTGVVWMSWQYRVVKNALGRGVVMGTEPGASVAAWFVPGLNLIRPYQVIRNLYRGSSNGSISLLVLAWWISALLSNIWFFAINFTLLASTITATTVAGGPGFSLFLAAQYLFLFFAELLSISIVQRIQRS